MALTKYSAFYYGHTIDKSNRFLNFDEGAGELTATLDLGSFTLTKFCQKLMEALNAVGTQEYTVTLDRDTRKIEISAPAPFDLLIDSGSQDTVSVFTLLGFTGNVDLTGQNSYESDSGSGFAYVTQSPLKNFSDFSKNKEKSEAQVKTTPGGIVEVIAYSILQRLKCELPLITDFTPQRYIRETATGVAEAIHFMDYAIGKAPLEFLYDYEDGDNFVPCILDKTESSPDGVGYELRERVRDSLPGYYELKGLVFLKIEVR